MYGLLLMNMKDYIISKYQQKKWDEIKTALKLESDDFGAFETFPEGQIIKGIIDFMLYNVAYK